IALCAATQDAVYLTQMLQELGMDLREPVLMLEDNQACIQLADKNMASPRLKHVDIRYHYVRTMAQENKIEIAYCPTYHQAAEILTKAVDQLTFLRHRATLMGLPNKI
ncbi:MAG: Ty1/Copia family ribonuclease HI, partial [bacterium]